MISKEKLNRINILAKESKIRKLSNEEKLEQKKLREEYIINFKESFKKQLDNIKIIDEKGK